MATPAERGFRIPSQTIAHERCLMAWPTMRRLDFWRGHLGAARDAYAIIARAINEYEPVLMIADEGEGRSAEGWMRGEVEVIELPIDDSFIRDNGPVFLTTPDGERAAAHFGFNAWGEKLAPWDRDAAVAVPLCDHLGIEVFEAPFVLEGGSIATDGAGTLVTTEQCLLNPNRNKTMTRAEIEDGLRDNLGVTTIVWLTNGLQNDWGTDGHIDNVLSFVAPGKVLLQSTADSTDADYLVARENQQRLEAAGIEVTAIDVLPHDECFEEDLEIPYVNLYVANGAVFVPLAGAAADQEICHDIGLAFPGRDIIGIPGRVLAYGGGGAHSITLGVPEGPSQVEHLARELAKAQAAARV
jgi:agmatine deiminase